MCYTIPVCWLVILYGTVKMIKQIQLRQNNSIHQIMATQFENTFFIFLSSLENSLIPCKGDEIFLDDNRFQITNVLPIITGKHIFDNYAVEVEKV